jgi:hypothetical protein
MKSRLIISILLITVTFLSCKKDTDTPDPGVVTTYPEIVDLNSDKAEIRVGGEDPAILTCEATGGNLSYVWEVDLGDIFAINESGSQVRFTGSECCVGDKLINCTVSNELGSVTETVTVHIFIP